MQQWVHTRPHTRSIALKQIGIWSSQVPHSLARRRRRTSRTAWSGHGARCVNCAVCIHNNNSPRCDIVGTVINVFRLPRRLNHQLADQSRPHGRHGSRLTAHVSRRHGLRMAARRHGGETGEPGGMLRQRQCGCLPLPDAY